MHGCESAQSIHNTGPLLSASATFRATSAGPAATAARVRARTKLALAHETVDTDAGAIGLLAGDEDGVDRGVDRELGLGQLRQHDRHERHVAQAIGRAATIQAIALANESERVALPALCDSRESASFDACRVDHIARIASYLGIGRNDVHVRADERDDLVALARIRDQQLHYAHSGHLR